VAAAVAVDAVPRRLESVRDGIGGGLQFLVGSSRFGYAPLRELCRRRSAAFGNSRRDFSARILRLASASHFFALSQSSLLQLCSVVICATKTVAQDGLSCHHLLVSTLEE